MTEVAAPIPATPSASSSDAPAETERVTTPGLTFPVVLHMPDTLRMNDEQFFALCQENREFRIERTAEGDLIIMSPVGGETGDLESELNFQLRLWAKTDGSGVPFSPSAGFALPSHVDRSPDAAWVLRERLTALTSRAEETVPTALPRLRGRTAVPLG